MQSEPIWKTLESVDFNIDKKGINEWTFLNTQLPSVYGGGVNAVSWRDMSQQ